MKRPPCKKVSISMRKDLLQEATAKARGNPHYRTLSGYVHNLLLKDLQAARSEVLP